MSASTDLDRIVAGDHPFSPSALVEALDDDELDAVLGELARRADNGCYHPDASLYVHREHERRQDESPGQRFRRRVALLENRLHAETDPDRRAAALRRLDEIRFAPPTRPDPS